MTERAAAIRDRRSRWRLLLLPLLFFWRKGGRLPTGDVFRASRLSRGNRLLPTQVLITPTSVVHYTPEVVGRREHSIHMAHVASVSIDTNLLFSDVLIETSGGATSGAVPRAPQEGRGADEGADRAASDRVLPQRPARGRELALIARLISSVRLNRYERDALWMI